MLRKYQTSIGSFTRKSTFFWASVGATVGLANLWQFPYLASIHGGGWFVLLYLVCLLAVTLPLMVTETVIGRYARHGIVLAMDGMVKNAGCSPLWRLVGPLSILAAFVVLSFTAVFGGIVLAYIFFGAAGRFEGVSEASATAILSELVSDPGHYRQFMAWHVFFVILMVAVSARGVVKGLERSMRMIVPCTLILMLALFGLAAMEGSLHSGVDHILVMRPEQVTAGSVKAALFHAFYTLGLGMGVWTIFGAYSTSHTRLKRSILAVVLMDTLVAIMAGLMVFSIAPDGRGLEGERGFSLLFISLPVALSGVPYSQVVIASVFLLVVLIVWATGLSLLEPVVGWFREWTGAPRGWSVVIIGSGIWFAGLASLFSFNLWADYRLGGATVFRWLELISGGIVIPAVAILIATFAGWCITRRFATTILGNTPVVFRGIWFWGMRLVLPVVAAWIGLQYTFFSLENLCENGSGAIWCQQSPVISSEPKEEPPEEGHKPEETPLQAPVETVQPAGSEQPNPEENAPKKADILYHSV